MVRKIRGRVVFIIVKLMWKWENFDVCIIINLLWLVRLFKLSKLLINMIMGIIFLMLFGNINKV